MNVNTGELFELPADLQRPVKLGEVLTAERLEHLEALAATDAKTHPLRASLEQARDQVRDGETIVAVSAKVAHQQRLGQRESTRRQRRRRARRS